MRNKRNIIWYRFQTVRCYGLNALNGFFKGIRDSAMGLRFVFVTRITQWRDREMEFDRGTRDMNDIVMLRVSNEWRIKAGRGRRLNSLTWRGPILTDANVHLTLALAFTASHRFQRSASRRRGKCFRPCNGDLHGVDRKGVVSASRNEDCNNDEIMKRLIH